MASQTILLMGMPTAHLELCCNRINPQQNTNWDTDIEKHLRRLAVKAIFRANWNPVIVLAAA